MHVEKYLFEVIKEYIKNRKHVQKCVEKIFLDFDVLI